METFRAIEEMGGQSSGEPLPLRSVGSLQVSARPDGLRQLEETARRAKEAGVTAKAIAVQDAMQLAPWLDLTPDTAALWLPDDGYIDPYSLCMAYAAEGGRRVVFGSV